MINTIGMAIMVIIPTSLQNIVLYHGWTLHDILEMIFC